MDRPYYYFRHKIRRYHRVRRPRFPMICKNLGDLAINKDQIVYFSLCMRKTAIFLFPVKHLTLPSCSRTPNTYEMQAFWRFSDKYSYIAYACVLDITKAFDKVNHYCMYVKLMHRKVPLQFLNVIINWYSKCFACVRWNNTLSSVFQLYGGVRQGGVLSPVFFTLYVNCQ